MGSRIWRVILPGIDFTTDLFEGDVVHVNAMGQHIVYLNTYEAACDLLEKRTSKYSDRPMTEMIKMCVLVALTLVIHGA